MSKYELVVFDLDGVLVDITSSWDWVHRCFGVSNDDGLAAYLSGEIDDREFMRRDIALWKQKKEDLRIGDIKAILDRAPIMKGAVETVRELKSRGIVCAIISGGLEYLAKRVGEPAGIDYIFANWLECDAQGYLTGNGISRVSLSAKDITLRNLLKDLGIAAERCAVIGDSVVDVCMFEIAGQSIAFNARENITKNGAKIVVEEKDLRLILRYILH